MGIKKVGNPKVRFSNDEVLRQSFGRASFFSITVILTYFDIIRYLMGMFVIIFFVTLIFSLIWNKFKGVRFIDFEELRFSGDFDKLSLELENNGLCLQRKVGEYYFFKAMSYISSLPEVRVREYGDYCILSVAEILKGRFDHERFISRDLQETVNTETRNI